MTQENKYLEEKEMLVKLVQDNNQNAINEFLAQDKERKHKIMDTLVFAAFRTGDIDMIQYATAQAVDAHLMRKIAKQQRAIMADAIMSGSREAFFKAIMLIKSYETVKPNEVAKEFYDLITQDLAIKTLFEENETFGKTIEILFEAMNALGGPTTRSRSKFFEQKKEWTLAEFLAAYPDVKSALEQVGRKESNFIGNQGMPEVVLQLEPKEENAILEAQDSKKYWLQIAKEVEPFVASIEEDNLVKLKNLLNKNMNNNIFLYQPSRSTGTILHLAFSRGDKDIINAMLGAINKADKEKRGLLKKILKIQNMRGENLLMEYAINSDNLEVVKQAIGLLKKRHLWNADVLRHAIKHSEEAEEDIGNYLNDLKEDIKDIEDYLKEIDNRRLSESDLSQKQESLAVRNQ